MTLAAFLTQQSEIFVARHPKSKALSNAAGHWRGGVPMHWMKDWAAPFPLYVDRAERACLTSVDGVVFDDFCLGDTPSMFGHARPELARALSEQAARGLGFMLPTETANRVADTLSERFNLPLWQVATTASDANRAVIRWARAITQRPKIVIFDGCYHGMVDDCFVGLKDGQAVHKPGLIGQVSDLLAFTRVIPFNDTDALKAALEPGDVAAVLCEPVMTNCGMIAPVAGFHEALRDLTRKAGTLLILDETHTLSSSYRGYAATHGLEPDMLTLGKAIAGGIPAAVWGVTAEVGTRMDEAEARISPGSSGIGTTLSGNALVMAVIETMLDEVITEAAYEIMLSRAAYLVNGLNGVIERRGLDWCTVHVGARAELVFAPEPPQNAQTMRRHLKADLLEAFHLYLINRGILIAPFHNMMLVSPQTEISAIDRLIDAVDGFAALSKDLT